MNILIIGAGGREHALAWKIKQSRHCDALYVAPGNGGTADIATNLPVNVNDVKNIKKAIRKYSVNLLVIGPEDPLVNGLVDELKAEKGMEDLLIVGPSKAAAQLEGSKEFAKAFMTRHGIPTAKAEVFEKATIRKGYEFLESLKPPFVLKADGLAAGKGVLITEDLKEAKSNLDSLILNKKFGDASKKVLIEEFLRGIEVSVFVLTDGKDYLILPEAKDYKRIGENNTGPNTGGMGAISPVLFADKDFMQKVEERIVRPTIEGIREEGMDYRGFLFIGLMNRGGEPYVVEYNVRMGDPETQAVMPRIKSDLVPLLESTARGQLSGMSMELEPYTSATLVLVSGGYPGTYEKGREIKFKQPVRSVLTFHAGTTKKADKLVTSGGRVMALSALGKNMGEALSKCYHVVPMIHWEDMYFRRDIGFDLKELGQ